MKTHYTFICPLTFKHTLIHNTEWKRTGEKRQSLYIEMTLKISQTSKLLIISQQETISLILSIYLKTPRPRKVKITKQGQKISNSPPLKSPNSEIYSLGTVKNLLWWRGQKQESYPILPATHANTEPCTCCCSDSFDS